MRFINRSVQLYAIIVIILTIAYYYLAMHFGVDNNGNSSVWWFAIYLALVFSSSLLISARDENSGYAGFNYHLVTYLIVSSLSFTVVLLKSSDKEKMDNLRGVLTMMLIWGIGVLFHLGMYLLIFRKNKIGSYEKDDVFK